MEITGEIHHITKFNLKTLSSINDTVDIPRFGFHVFIKTVVIDLLKLPRIHLLSIFDFGSGLIHKLLELGYHKIFLHLDDKILSDLLGRSGWLTTN